MISPVEEEVGTVETWSVDADQSVRGTSFFSFVEDGALGTDPTGERWWAIAREPDATPLLMRRPEFERLATPRWLPWVFKPAASPWLSSSVGLGVNASGIVLLGLAAGTRIIDATEVLPVPMVFGLINPGQLRNRTTELSEAGCLMLIAPGLPTRGVRIHDFPDPAVTPLSTQRTTQALSAVADLMTWLHRSRDEIGDIAGFSLRASQYWAHGMKPRPATVRRLFEIHALTSSLVRELGDSGAREWLQQPAAEGQTRVDLLATREGFAEVLREASPLIFAERPRVERPIPETADLDGTAAMAEEHDSTPFAGGPRRPRRLDDDDEP